jgi:hypothetical protein
MNFAGSVDTIVATRNVRELRGEDPLAISYISPAVFLRLVLGIVMLRCSR